MPTCTAVCDLLVVCCCVEVVRFKANQTKLRTGGALEDLAVQPAELTEDQMLYGGLQGTTP